MHLDGLPYSFKVGLNESAVRREGAVDVKL